MSDLKVNSAKEASLFDPTKIQEEQKPAEPLTTAFSGNRSILSSCRICLSNILDPASLVCGHRFCESCLNKYWKANEEPNYVVCPLCRDYAFKIGFVQKEKVNSRSTRDFRKKFDPDHIDIPPAQSKNYCFTRSSLFISVWPIVLSILYLLVRLIKPFILDILLVFN